MSVLARRRAMMGGKKGFVHGTWEDLFRAIDAGTYATEYAVGEVLPLDLGSTYGAIGAEIVGFNIDTISDSTDTASVTFVSKHLIKVKHRFNPETSGTTEGTGPIGGWGKCELRSYLQNTILPLFPNVVKNRISTVKKYSSGFNTSNQFVQNMPSDDNIWIPSSRELCKDAGNTIESLGPRYTGLNTSAKRTKIPAGGSSAGTWITRTGYNSKNTNIWICSTSGSVSSTTATSTNNYYAVGFCVG